MKQLLTWCGSRALLDKPSGDVKNSNAIMAGEMRFVPLQSAKIDKFQHEQYSKS